MNEMSKQKWDDYTFQHFNDETKTNYYSTRLEISKITNDLKCHSPSSLVVVEMYKDELKL